MILCVDSKALKTSPNVQRDVDLEDILNNHTKYFDNEEEAVKEDYFPLDFSISVRSTYTNLVLQTEIEDGSKRYYTNLAGINDTFIHKGYDLIMYLTSIGLLHNIDYALGFDDIMMKHSHFQPIGIYNCDPYFINPIIYSHVIITDEGVEELPKYLKGYRKFVPIKDIKSNGNIPAMLDTFIEITKEETKDA